MGWTETCAMDERLQFVREALRADAGETMSSLCQRYGVSRKTGYKWLARFEQAGRSGLGDRSRAPHSHPNAVEDRAVQRIVALRRRYPHWGANKLLPLLQQRWPEQGWPAASTVGEILKRKGLVEPSQARPRSKAPAPTARPIVADEPNALWTIDFKGNFRTADGRWVMPLTLEDAYSRYLLRAQIVDAPSEAQVRHWMEHTFRRHGLPQAIRSDNGTPFVSTGLAGLTRLSVWWLKLGIELQRTAPGHPEHNPRHERMHRTLAAEAANPPKANRCAQQRALDQFRRRYNFERPHEALGQRTPASIYQRSRRTYPRVQPQFVYPEDMVVVCVARDGQLNWDRRTIFLSEALRREWVGLRQIEPAQWAVFLGTLPIALLDARERKIRPYEQPVARTRDAV